MLRTRADPRYGATGGSQVLQRTSTQVSTSCCVADYRVGNGDCLNFRTATRFPPFAGGPVYVFGRDNGAGASSATWHPTTIG